MTSVVSWRRINSEGVVGGVIRGGRPDRASSVRGICLNNIGSIGRFFNALTCTPT